MATTNKVKAGPACSWPRILALIGQSSVDTSNLKRPGESVLSSFVLLDTTGSRAPAERNEWSEEELCSGSPIAEPVPRRLVSANLTTPLGFELSAPFAFSDTTGTI